LAIACNDEERPQGTVPTFGFETGAWNTDRVFTYELPLATFIEFARCSTAAIRVGDMTVPFTRHQLAELRVFGSGMRAEVDAPGAVR
jgi:hypothetical protein